MSKMEKYFGTVDDFFPGLITSCHITDQISLIMLPVCIQEHNWKKKQWLVFQLNVDVAWDILIKNKNY